MGYVPVDINYAVRRECLRRSYSERTIETYTDCIKKFIDFSGKTIDKLSKKDVLDFLDYLSERKYSGSSMHVYHMAIRFLMEDIFNKSIKLNIKYSRRPERLPFVLSREEVAKLINSISNEKYKLMISLMYGAGLRVSELTNLRVKDLNIEKNFGFVRQGKGNKDRIFIIPLLLKYKINELISVGQLNKEDNLFLTNQNKKYSIRSLQIIVKNAGKKAGLNFKEVHCHTLRHSFATHLIEQGQSVSEVQSLLGHKSPETTFIYLHTAAPNMIKIKSPLDSLN